MVAMYWMGDHQGRPSAPTSSIHKLHMANYQILHYDYNFHIVKFSRRMFTTKLVDNFIVVQFNVFVDQQMSKAIFSRLSVIVDLKYS